MKPNWIPEIVRERATSVNLEGEIMRRIEFVYNTYYCAYDSELRKKIHRVRKIVHEVLRNEEVESIRVALVLIASLLLVFGDANVRDGNIITILLYGVSGTKLTQIVHENPIRYRMIVTELAKKFSEKNIPIDLNNALTGDLISGLLESTKEESEEIEISDESDVESDKSDVESDESDVMSDKSDVMSDESDVMSEVTTSSSDVSFSSLEEDESDVEASFQFGSNNNEDVEASFQFGSPDDDDEKDEFDSTIVEPESDDDSLVFDSEEVFENEESKEDSD